MADNIVDFSIARAIARGEPITESLATEMFAERHRAFLRYCAQSARWHQWSGACWRPVVRQVVVQLVRDLVDEIEGKAPTPLQLRSKKYISAVEGLAQGDRKLIVERADLWDADLWRLATPGGTVDLRSGNLVPSFQSDLISKCTAVTPEADLMDMPRFWAFLNEATGGDEGRILLIQQMCGLALTGCIEEHVLFFLWGPGGNGKGVLVNIIDYVLGDYSITAPSEVFASQKGYTRHSQELARLRGARLVSTSETEEGAAWNDARIKLVTGGEPITARFMRENDFTFLPQFTLLISGNHMPSFKSIDDAIRRRLVLIRFDRKPKTVDRRLLEALKDEAPSILRWMIKGCLMIQQPAGLVRPASVVEDTEEYLEAQDVFKHWIEDKCEIGHGYSYPSSGLYRSWSDYARANGQEPGDSRVFATKLKPYITGKDRKERGYVYFGIQLKLEPENEGYGRYRGVE